MSLNQAEIDAILADVLNGAPVAAPASETPAPELPTGEAPPEAVVETAETVSEAPEEKPQPGYVSALMKKLHDERRALDKQRQELEARRKEPEPTKESTRQWTKSAVKENFREFITKELGWDLGKVGRALMSDALGENSPDEYRAIASELSEKTAIEAKIEALQAEIQSLRADQDESVQSSVADQIRAEYDSMLDQYVKGDVASKHPHAARALEADRNDALAEIRAIVADDARAKLERGEGDALSPSEALAAYEARQAKLAKRFGFTPQAPPADQAAAPVTTPVPPGQPRKTLTSATPSNPPLTSGRDPRNVDSRFKDAMDWFLKQ